MVSLQIEFERQAMESQYLLPFFLYTYFSIDIVLVLHMCRDDA